MLHLLYDLVFVSIISALFYIAWKIWKYVYDIARLPPGPIGLPFVGAVNKLDPNHVRETIQKWKKEYGDIFSFTLPGQSVVVVSSYELIKEVLLTRSEEFSGRPQSYRINSLFDHHPVLGNMNDSPLMRLMKKTLNTSLKMYGERLLKLEDISLDSVKEMFDYWRTFDGKPFDPQQSIHDATGRIITSLAYGKPMTKEQFVENLDIQHNIAELFAPGGLGQMLEFMPWVRFFGLSFWERLQSIKTKFDALFQNIHGNCKANFDGGNPECVAQALILAQDKTNKEIGGKEVLTDMDIFNLARMLIGAGTGTTFRATHAFVAILTNNPELQERLQQEVDEAVGDKTPRLADKEKMPYVEASMYELLRYISHVPTLVPHAAMKDTTLAGYTVPKGTQVWINAFGLHHDPRYWEEPWKFKPERFLDENGVFVTPDHLNRRRLLPFGAGRRVCSGEVLAKNRLFLMMSGIVQNFTFKPKSETEKPDSDPRNYRPGFIVHPNDYEIRAIPRKV